MKRQIEVVPGQRFNRWTVLHETAPGTGGARRVRARCDCGTERETNFYHVRSGHSRSCGCYAREATRRFNRSAAGNWRGGRRTDEHGYVMVYEPEHPNAKSNGYVPEHRLVMSGIVGRPLERAETVHHVNGDKADNRPENLELWCNSHPSGQRVTDLLAWARHITEKYAAIEGVLA